MKKRSVLMFVFLFALFAIGAGVGNAQDDVIVVATNISDLQSIDPAQNGSSTNLALFYIAYERLYELPADPSQPLIPNLAESHTVSEDGFTWTFKLREDVTFASGNPFTAADVVFSWKRVQNFQNEPAQVFNLFVGDVVAVDDYTLEVKLSDAVFPLPIPFFDVLTALPSFSVLDSQLVMANGGSLDPSADTAGEWLNQNSAGSGPFVISGWTPDSEVRLTRNENYWGEKPAISGIILRQVSDSTTALQLVERGEVDIAQNLDKDLTEQIRSNPNLSLEAGQTLQIVYLALSPSDSFEGSPLVDAKVRQAITQAIDYDGIVDSLMGGLAIRPAGVVPLGILGSEGSLPFRYERNLEAARALLAEAGYGDGFELTLHLPARPLGGLSSEILAAKLVADLAEVGITVTPQIDAPSVFTSGRNAGEYSAFVTTFSADFFDPTNWTVLFAVPDFQNIAAYIRLANPALAEAAFATLFAPPEQRELAVIGFQQVLSNEAIYSVLYQPQTIDAVSTAVSGYTFHPIELIDYAQLSK